MRGSGLRWGVQSADKQTVNRYGISLTVFAGSIIGILLCYPSPPATSLLIFGALNGSFALICCAFGVHILRYFGLASDE
jgi:hypothetical protein